MREAAAKLLQGEAEAELKLEQLDRAVRNHPDHAARIAAKAKAWDAEQAPANAAALVAAQKLVPSDISNSSASGVAKSVRDAHSRGALPKTDGSSLHSLSSDANGNSSAGKGGGGSGLFSGADGGGKDSGKGGGGGGAGHAAAGGSTCVGNDDEQKLTAMSKRVWERKALWLVHMERGAIAKTHIADLKNKYQLMGLDLDELRAVYAALPTEFENDGNGAKAEWRAAARKKLEEAVAKSAAGKLPKLERRHSSYALVDSAAPWPPPPPPTLAKRSALLGGGAGGGGRRASANAGLMAALAKRSGGVGEGAAVAAAAAVAARRSGAGARGSGSGSGSGAGAAGGVGAGPPSGLLAAIERRASGGGATTDRRRVRRASCPPTAPT